MSNLEVREQCERQIDMFGEDGVRATYPRQFEVGLCLHAPRRDDVDDVGDDANALRNGIESFAEASQNVAEARQDLAHVVKALRPRAWA